MRLPGLTRSHPCSRRQNREPQRYFHEPRWPRTTARHDVERAKIETTHARCDRHPVPAAAVYRNRTFCPSADQRDAAVAGSQRRTAVIQRLGNSSRSIGNFSLAPKCAIASLASEQSMWTLRHIASKGYVVLRQMPPVIRKGLRALRAARFHSAEKNFDLFHAANLCPAGSCSQAGVAGHLRSVAHCGIRKRTRRSVSSGWKHSSRCLPTCRSCRRFRNFQRARSSSLLGIAADRITVTYPAPDVHFRPDPDADDARLAKFDVEPFQYLLAVGTREPRKNFKTVAEAYAALPAATQARYPAAVGRSVRLG